ncbi:pyridoxal phosphate-dependent decarboxylase family protein [Roseibium sp. SCP14]|uniref:pyridoxal phosphate-dependent decarboxylase family protein n=1 Tax=Roseibium sp. SCP14 TaxID=3141375 RepID=UPI003338C71A
MSDRLRELERAYSEAVSYRLDQSGRDCAPDRTYREMREIFREPLPETGCDGTEVIGNLAQKGAGGLTGMTHPRFFGWVLGGSAPVGVAADWLVSAWGQNAAFHASSPTAAAVEEVAGEWLLDILDLPRDAAVGFVTGGTVGNFTALAAARGAVLKKHGWNADRDGLFGAPPVRIFVGDDAHTSVFSVLGYLGFGRERVCRIATDREGRMDAEDLQSKISTSGGPGIVIAQAGQINTGAFDPFDQLIKVARNAGAWVHVDGAFGMWSRAHPAYRYLTEGAENADSWSVDGHKWLQTPFDSGYAIVRDKIALETAMGIDASYLPARQEGDRVPAFLVPELSRRARGIPTWAMLKHLGRDGVRELVGLHCSVARQIANRLERVKGIRVLNDVVLNQVVIAFGDPGLQADLRKKVTEDVIARLRESGTMFVSGGRWRGEWIMRLSVICNATKQADADPVADVIESVWADLAEARGL